MCGEEKGGDAGVAVIKVRERGMKGLGGGVSCDFICRNFHKVILGSFKAGNDR